MSTEGYLDKLDTNQLKTVKEFAEKLIKSRTQGPQIGYWEVYSGEFPTEFFADNCYVEACARMVEIMRLNGHKPNAIDCNKNVQLEYKMDYPCDLPDTLKPHRID